MKRILKIAAGGDLLIIGSGCGVAYLLGKTEIQQYIEFCAYTSICYMIIGFLMLSGAAEGTDITRSEAVKGTSLKYEHYQAEDSKDFLEGYSLGMLMTITGVLNLGIFGGLYYLMYNSL